MREHLSRMWSRVVDFVLVDVDETQRVDTDYLLSERVQYEWITVRDDETVRCDICGRLMPVTQMPELMDHVASHDEQGAAEVDPTQTPDDVYAVEVHELENNDEKEPHRI